MRRFSDFRKVVSEAEEKTPSAIPNRPNPLATELGRVIDQFVSKLKNQLANSNVERRGVWDRVKGWWSNLWHGRDNQSNPYYWQNKLGDTMGSRVESVLTPIPLGHYKVLRHQSFLLEEMLPAGAEKLQIMRTIDIWAKEFKTAILGLANRHEPPSDPFPEPESEKPISTPEPEKMVSTSEPEKVVPNEEEDWKKKASERLESLKHKMSLGRYGTLKGYIHVGNRSQVDKFLDFFEKRISKPDEPAGTPEPSIDKPEEIGKTPVDEFMAPSSSGTRLWHELSTHDQAEWDRWGGGISGDITWGTKELKIHTLPWILRIGDPRLGEIRAIKNSALYKRLEGEKRIESTTHPIKNKVELERAVEHAKMLYYENKKWRSEQNKKKTDTTKLRKAIKSRLKTSPKVTLPKPEEKTPEERTATMKKEPKPEEKSTETGQTARMKLSPPQGKIKQHIEELDATLDSMKSELDEEKYKKLKKMIGHLEKNPEKIGIVQDEIEEENKIIKRKIKKEKPPEDDDDDYDVNSLKYQVENTMKDKKFLLVNEFRKLARR